MVRSFGEEELEDAAGEIVSVYKLGVDQLSSIEARGEEAELLLPVVGEMESS